MTLIAGVMGRDGLILSADSEESIAQPNALRTWAEKIHVIQQPQAHWKIVIAGAGDTDFIGMAKDFIAENMHASTDGNDVQIVGAIRKAIHDIWKDFIQYEQGQVDLSLLIGSWSNDQRLRFTVVRNAAIRNGRDLEAMGIGDSVFRGLADRYLQYGRLGHVPGDMEVLRYFVIYAMQQAKAVPGVGGNTRILTLGSDGELKWEKSFKIGEVTRFFGTLEGSLRYLISSNITGGEEFVRHLGKIGRKSIRALRKQLEEIENNPSLI